MPDDEVDTTRHPWLLYFLILRFIPEMLTVMVLFSMRAMTPMMTPRDRPWAGLWVMSQRPG